MAFPVTPYEFKNTNINSNGNDENIPYVTIKIEPKQKPEMSPTQKAEGLMQFYWSLRNRGLPTIDVDNKLSFDIIIQRIEEWLNTTDFSNFKNLCISSQGLTFIPEQISRFKNLRWLNISGNYLTDLPDSMSELENLEDLNIAENKFTKSPTVIEKIKSLKVLYRDDSIGSSKLIGPFTGECYFMQPSECAIL